MNETWRGRDLYEPFSAGTFARCIERIPAFGYGSLLVLEKEHEILACLGFWDWSRIASITVEAHGTEIPGFLKRGEVLHLKQMMLTFVGFKDPADLAVLFKDLNNRAFAMGIQQIFAVGKRDGALLTSTAGFAHSDAKLHLYIKPLEKDVSMSGGPVFVEGIDL